MIVADGEVAIEVGSYQNELVRSKNLVAAARSGSSAAFAELREIYAQRVYRKLLTMTKNREDAEDALQDTFLRAYLAIHTFEERSSFYTWVMRIAINSALMILRKRRIRPEVSFDGPGETEEAIAGFEIKDSGPSPERICVHRQRYAYMVRSIWNLQPRLRQVLEMQDDGGLFNQRDRSSTRNIRSRRQIQAFPGASAAGLGSYHQEFETGRRYPKELNAFGTRCLAPVAWSSAVECNHDIMTMALANCYSGISRRRPKSGPE